MAAWASPMASAVSSPAAASVVPGQLLGRLLVGVPVLDQVGFVTHVCYPSWGNLRRSGGDPHLATTTHQRGECVQVQRQLVTAGSGIPGPSVPVAPRASRRATDTHTEQGDVTHCTGVSSHSRATTRDPRAAPHQRSHPRQGGPPHRTGRRSAGDHAGPRGAADGQRPRARPRRGGPDGQPAGVPDHGLRQVPVRGGPEGQGVPAQVVERVGQGGQVPAQDRSGRLRRQGPQGRPVHPRRAQGQGHAAVPGSRDGPPGARHEDPRPGARRGRVVRQGRDPGPPRRSQHVDGPVAGQEGARGPTAD